MVPNAPLESQGEWTGAVEQVVADDFQHGRSVTRWYLSTSGAKRELFFADGQTPRPNTVIRVTGIGSANRIAVATLTLSGGERSACMEVQRPDAALHIGSFFADYPQRPAQRIFVMLSPLATLANVSVQPDAQRGVGGTSVGLSREEITLCPPLRNSCIAGVEADVR